MTKRKQLKKQKDKLKKRLKVFNKTKNKGLSLLYMAKIKRRIIAIRVICRELLLINETDEQKKDISRPTNVDKAKEMWCVANEIEESYFKLIPEISYKYGISDRDLIEFQKRYIPRDIHIDIEKPSARNLVNEEISKKLKLTKERFRSLTAANTYIPFKN
jgi:hypothetical protein